MEMECILISFNFLLLGAVWQRLNPLKIVSIIKNKYSNLIFLFWFGRLLIFLTITFFFVCDADKNGGLNYT